MLNPKKYFRSKFGGGIQLPSQSIISTEFLDILYIMQPVCKIHNGIMQIRCWFFWRPAFRPKQSPLSLLCQPSPLIRVSPASLSSSSVYSQNQEDSCTSTWEEEITHFCDYSPLKETLRIICLLNSCFVTLLECHSVKLLSYGCLGQKHESLSDYQLRIRAPRLRPRDLSFTSLNNTSKPSKVLSSIWVQYTVKSSRNFIMGRLEF